MSVGRRAFAGLVAALATLPTGCGLKGDLYLEDETAAVPASAVEDESQLTPNIGAPDTAPGLPAEPPGNEPAAAEPADEPDAG